MGVVEGLKESGRVAAGWLLHHAGLYRGLLPCNLQRPAGMGRRLQAYLLHYYRTAATVEATLSIPDLSVKVACDLKDHMLNPFIMNAAPIYEYREIAYCRSLVRDGDRIVDIGANHGLWGFTLAHAGRAVRVFLCEANPTIIRRLKHTARLNAHIDATVLPYAIGDGNRDRVSFYLPLPNPAGNLSGLGSTVLHDYAVQHDYLSGDRRITVAARSIDQLMDSGELDGMDLVKVDVEQAEDAVIAGAMNALKHFRPRLIMVETSISSRASTALCNLGYDAYLLDDNGREAGFPDGGYWGNIFFRMGSYHA